MLYKWPIIGHEEQLKRLEADLKNGHLAHAYIFVGPDKVGKFLVAKTLAGILQCPNNYCRSCPTCVQVMKGVHLDTIEMRDDGESIKIERVRALIASVNMTAQSNYKIVLLDNIGRMGDEAANCFLKTLEEPPRSTLFLMTANNLRELLPTIVSRSRIVKFPAIPEEKLKKKVLEMKDVLKIEATEDAVERACMLSLGRPGKAIELMQDVDAMREYLRVYNDARSFFLDKDLTKRFMYVQSVIDKLEDDPKILDVFLETLLYVARSFLNAKVNSGENDNEDFPEIISFSKDDLINLVHKIEETRYFISRNINAKLALENLMLSF
ncbi:MAG: hypothetical protein ACD_63C00061G0003 [uncultured bacterium]|nr:MAG: hypothetical protein ACD_63C00061G0003 [uncultured bacterium]KKT01958.1 MAG: replication ATPase, DNA polymerase III subunit delta' protein [Candidatus Peregrinibacteria bacterium GW2011_GWF2_43_17]HAU39614.1 hypothetical protein [Candidatus Peregrinibacteria bacterium]